jgi:flagellar basal body-associated protein FliL
MTLLRWLKRSIITVLICVMLIFGLGTFLIFYWFSIKLWPMYQDQSHMNDRMIEHHGRDW